jgi:TATA-box binding protein (TBP) (component of TFIID and TFIIIB)
MNNLFSLNFLNLPADIVISTMTLTCKIDTIFNVTNIGQYIDLKYGGIVSVKHGSVDDKTTNRSLNYKKNNSAKKKKKKKSFYNQVTLSVYCAPNNYVNVKLFSNGAIQMTGCKSFSGALDVLKNIIISMKTVKAILDFKTNAIIEKPYAENLLILDISNLYDFKICMINSNFSIGFEIDRDILYELLLKNNIDSTFDPINHACVNIKYDHPLKIISIFVFETGNIIITGACSCQQINDAYMFINKFLLEHYHFINKNNILTNSTILECLSEIT